MQSADDDKVTYAALNHMVRYQLDVSLSGYVWSKFDSKKRETLQNKLIDTLFGVFEDP